jgi:hypothetical protein
MRRLSLVFLVLTCLCPAPARADSPHAQSDLATNAALQYWMAFSQMPTLDSDQEKHFAAGSPVNFDDPAVQRLIASSHQSLLFLQRGAALERCDWGLEYKDGISLLLPHLSKSRDLARLASLRARQSFEQGHYGAARGDAMSMMTLARHMGRDPIMICLLVRIAIEGMVIDLVAPYVPDLKASYSQAAAQFDSLPAAATLKDTIPVEKKYFAGWIAAKLKDEEARSPGAWRDLWRALSTGEGVESPEAIKKVDSISQAIKMVEDILPIYDELERFVVMPNDQFDAQYPAFKQKTKAEFPLAGLIVPAVDQLRAKEQRHQTRMAMLLAGIAVAEGGPDKLKEIKDPFGSGPFEYRALDKGFELKSKLQFEGQPVTLTIGQRK